MTIFCKFSTINISKLNFCLVICIAKNLIWTTLNAIFAISKIQQNSSIVKYYKVKLVKQFQMILKKPF